MEVTDENCGQQSLARDGLLNGIEKGGFSFDLYSRNQTILK